MTNEIPRPELSKPIDQGDCCHICVGNNCCGHNQNLYLKEPKMSESLTRVFVYGTLKQGRGNHCLLANSKFVSQGRTDIQYHMRCNGGFPSVFKSSFEGGSICGEIYEVCEDTLHQLDTLEGVASGMYFREEVIIRTEFGAPTVAHIYFRNNESLEVGGTTVAPVYGVINWNGSMQRAAS